MLLSCRSAICPRPGGNNDSKVSKLGSKPSLNCASSPLASINRGERRPKIKFQFSSVQFSSGEGNIALSHKPKQGPRAADEARRLPPRRQGDAGALCVARRSPPSPILLGENSPCTHFVRARGKNRVAESKSGLMNKHIVKDIDGNRSGISFCVIDALYPSKSGLINKYTVKHPVHTARGRVRVAYA